MGFKTGLLTVKHLYSKTSPNQQSIYAKSAIKQRLVTMPHLGKVDKERAFALPLKGSQGLRKQGTLESNKPLFMDSGNDCQ